MEIKLDNSLDPVLKMFSAENWSRLNADDRLNALQQFENCMAKMQGRDPLKVGIISPNDPDYERCKDACGVHTSANNTIRLNRIFFENRSTGISGVDQNNVWSAVNTLLHEGRHAWQTWLVRNVPEDADPVVLRRLLLSTFSYHAPWEGKFIYAAQANEVDARRYAIEMLQHIGEYMISHGFSAFDYRACRDEMERAFREEILWFEGIKASLDDEIFEALSIKDGKDTRFLLEVSSVREQKGIHWDGEKLNRVRALMDDEAFAEITSFDDFLLVADDPDGVLKFAEGEPLPIEYPEKFTDHADSLEFKDNARLKAFLEKIDRTPAINDAAADIRVRVDDIK